MPRPSEPLHGAHERAAWHIVALTYGCETCGAMPGQDCMSSSGTRRPTEVHVARTDAASARGWAAADVPLVCTNCGNDLAVDGHLWCLDCLEERAQSDAEV